MTATNEGDVCFMSATELLALYKRKEISPVEVMRAIYDRIETFEPKVNSFALLVSKEKAMQQAAAAEKSLMAAGFNDLPALVGLPVSVKDLECTAGVRTAFGSKYYEDHIPDYDAVIWARLKAKGAILIGKTTTPEFGLHSTTESPLTGTTNNPWDVTRTAGGSSGGAAAAVASGFGPLATGSDGGGSIRVPASFCGIVGLKPSCGRIPFNSRHSAYESVVAVGPMTRTVADSALMLNATAGPDLFDAVSLLDASTDYLNGLEGAQLKGVKIAYCVDFGGLPVESNVEQIVSAAVRTLERDLGATVDVISLVMPDVFQYFNNWWMPLVSKEMQEAILTPFGNLDQCHPLVSAFMERAKQITLADYIHTHTTLRTQLHTAFADVFNKYDLLVWPTTPMVAYTHPGKKNGPSHVAGKWMQFPELANQSLTEAISHTGFPAISVPAGFTSEGLPVGLQIAAGHGKDLQVLRAAASFESASPWRQRMPVL